MWTHGQNRRPNRSRPSRPADATGNGFTVVELLVTVAIMATVAAISVALVSGTLASMRLGMARSDIARELRSARLAAASANRPVRVRFNCPAAGQYRTVELIGTPGAPDAKDSDADATRCSATTYPYPAADQNPLTRPNYDGPIRYLPAGVSFGSTQTIEFWPNGSAHLNGGSNPWPTITIDGISLTVVKGSSSKSVTVTGVGRVNAQ